MKTIESVLRQEAKQLRDLVKRAERRVKKSPKGQLRAAYKKETIDCYYKKEKNSKWIYLKKTEHGLARELVHRDYDLQLRKRAGERIHAIERFLDLYKKTDVKEIYMKMSPGRRMLIGEHVTSDETYMQQWLSYRYEGKIFSSDEAEIVTERGERVRSKSEKIIADKLYSLGIPYRYECPLVFGENLVIYPDFTILCPATREEVYLEHFGRMSDAVYVEKTMFKLATYEKNGIYLGVNLFATFETGKRALNTRALDDFLRKVFCEEECAG